MTTGERPLTGRERGRPSVSKRRLTSRRVGPLPAWAILAAAAGLIAIVGIAAANTLSGAESGGDSPTRIRYDVGQPGVGEIAPDFELPSAMGEPFRLSAQRGRQVLLYFHEGLGCAPCWKQIEDIQADLETFTALGLDTIAAISIDPASAQRQRAETRRISVPVLADQNRGVSATYDALAYGMMMGATPGHTFILVGRDGVIRWRADYGGPPEYTMYVPNPTLVAELRAALDGAEPSSR